MSTRLGRWHFDDHGEPADVGGAAVVLLHGLALDRRMWAGQIVALRGVSRVLAFDGPGHGLFELAPPFTLEEQADALAEALDGAGVARAVLVGHCWGGMVALRLALQHPRRVAGLALVGTSAGPEPRLRRGALRTLAAWVPRLGAPRWLVHARLAPRIYGARALRQRPELAVELHRTLAAQSREGLARAALAVGQRESIASRLRRVAVPTLVICGQDDRITPTWHSEALARRIPGARLVLLAAGHTPPVEVPAQTAGTLLPFVRARLGQRALAYREMNAS